MIGIGSDHGGFELKNKVKEYLKSRGYDVKDYGAYTPNSVDYPDIARAVCTGVTSGQCECAILVCGTGIGISIAANKIKGIRCALCADSYSAKMTKCHNDANVIALGGRVIGEEVAYDIVQSYLDAQFMGERHQVRVQKIMDLEK